MRTKFLSLFFTILVATAPTYAGSQEMGHYDQAPYLIMQGGHGRTNFGLLEGWFESSIGFMKIKDRDGLAGRIALGKNLNRYFSLELGVASYPSSTRIFSTAGSRYLDNSIYADSKINRIFASDLMMMGQVSAFGQRLKLSAGAGITSIRVDYAEMVNPPNTAMKQAWESGSADYLAPKLEARIGSRVKPNLDIYTSVSNIFSVGRSIPSDRDWLPNLSTTTVGVMYYF